VYSAKQESEFDHRTQEQRDDDEPILWHVSLISTHRFDTPIDEAQDYALIVSLEHPDENIRIYQPVRTRVVVRARQNWR
jgi:hypothetical protein